MISLDNISIYQYGKPNAIVTIPKSSPYGWDLNHPQSWYFLLSCAGALPPCAIQLSLREAAQMLLSSGGLWADQKSLRDSSNDFHVFMGGWNGWLIGKDWIGSIGQCFFWDCLQNTKYSIVYWRTTNTDMSNIEMGVREVLKLTWGTPRVQSKVKTHWWYDDHDPPSRSIQKIGSLQDWGGSSCVS